MDWNNVDLKSDYERNKPILSEYTFDTLLLEVSCNLREINACTIAAQFELELQNRVREAREIFEANLDNILKEALEYRSIE